MSYILDALRRSQAERDRGQVPGLNAQPAAVAAVPLRRGGPRWRWAVGALLTAAMLVFTLLWWLRAGPAVRPDAPAPAAAGAAAPMGALPAAPTAQGGPLPAPQAPSALPVVVSVPPTPPAVQSAGTGSEPLPLLSPAPAVVSPAAPPAAAPARPPAAAAAAVTPLAALTPEQRRELPPLVMGGSIWSDSALSRFVIVNGQVVREGETAAPGVVIERIGPKAVLLRWRELRLELPL